MCPLYDLETTRCREETGQRLLMYAAGKRAYGANQKMKGLPLTTTQPHSMHSRPLLDSGHMGDRQR